MSNFFNMDNSLWRFLGRLADVMILNIVFLITCLPVVTIGAAWTSLSYVTLKMSRDEESYIVKSYFKAFRQNFRQGYRHLGNCSCSYVYLLYGFPYCEKYGPVHGTDDVHPAFSNCPTVYPDTAVCIPGTCQI